MKYPHGEIEKKWQERWQTEEVYRTSDDATKEKYYVLVEFPYPSGAGLHVGHPRSYTALDIVSRVKRMEGKNVLFPMGWDAFGLPAENYAIKTGVHPAITTKENIAIFRRQLQSIGFSFDWSREVDTTDPKYYKWTQWMFLEFFKAGLAYKANMAINWCPKDKIGLANEEVVGGKCERCGTDVEKKNKEQWMIAITKYAERLLSDLDTVDYLPKIRKQQEDWIGKSEGAEVTFRLNVPGQDAGKHQVAVFTTRPDTLFGATFLVVSPELAKTWMDVGWQAPAEVAAYVKEALARSEMDRSNDTKEKTGVFSGVVGINPVNGKEIPVWVADYVLGNYGTGAIMAVPAHDARDFAFAKKFGLEIIEVVSGDGELPRIAEGGAINSDFLNGLGTHAAKEKMIAWLEEKQIGQKKTTYKLRDWVFSRQRYWGEPIPLVHCASCNQEQGGWVPVPTEQLPVILPNVEKYQPTDTGESPLATISDWVNTKCPQCGGPATRETDTMPNWAGSSWYFLRYIDPHNDAMFADPEKLKKWMPVDLYNGGMEHTTLHLLYSRFWNKFLFDRGYVPTAEPYARRHSHGLILGDGGEKMSKSKGNVVNPDDIVKQHGADTLRLYEMFMGPFEEPVPWSENGVIGVRRFLEKVYAVQNGDYISKGDPISTRDLISDTLTRLAHKTTKKVRADIEQFRFNTAVSALMIFLNALAEEKNIPQEMWERFLIILSPFAPHLAEECWSVLGKTSLIVQQPWPTYDESLTKDTEVTIAVQVMGKLRETVLVPARSSQEEVYTIAQASEKIQKYLEGKKVARVVFVQDRLINFIVE